jgi:purine nucleoside permease
MDGSEPDIYSIARFRAVASQHKGRTMNNQDIPEAVIAMLARVREDGRTNMFDRAVVIRIGTEYADTDEDYAALDWLYMQPKRYVEALKAMGKRVSRAR